MPYTAPTLTPAIGLTYTFGSLAAKITDVSFGGLKIETKDATNQTSTKTGTVIWKEFIAGLGDSGTVTLKSEFVGVIPALGTCDALAIVIPTTTPKTIGCQALLVGFKPDLKFGDGMVADIEFKVTGVITVT